MRSMRLFWIISLFGLAIPGCNNIASTAEPTATPVPGLILFMRENGRGGQDVWIAQGDGSEERNLISDVQDGWIGNAYLTSDEDRVTFVLYTDSSNYFYVSDIQGQESKVMVSGEQVYYLRSPEGNHLLVQSIEGNDQTLRLITPDGRENKKLYEDSDEYWHYFDLPEDAASSFAYSRIPRFLDGKEASLKILKLETGEEIEITSAYESYIFPAYQSDGENLRYILLDPEESNGVYNTNWALYNTDLSGSKQELIDEGVLRGNFQFIQWAYDGSSALISTNGGYEEGYYLHRITADGSINMLASREDYIVIEGYAPTAHDRYWAYLTWESDTEEYTLYLVRDGEDPRPVVTDYGIWFRGLSKDGLRFTYITQKEIDGDLTVYVASWDDLRVVEVGRAEYSAGSMFTSDGEYVLVIEQDDEGLLNLNSANADGSQPNRLSGSLNDLYGSFSPDEEWIIFGGELAGDNTGNERWSQYLYNFSSGEQIELTSAAPYLVSYGYSPDGRYIVYDVYSADLTAGSRAIYRAQIDGSQAMVFIPNAYSPAWASNQAAGIWTEEGTISSPGGLFGGLGGP